MYAWLIYCRASTKACRSTAPAGSATTHDAELPEQVGEWVRTGFRSVKIKVGRDKTARSRVASIEVRDQLVGPNVRADGRRQRRVRGAGGARVGRSVPRARRELLRGAAVLAGSRRAWRSSGAARPPGLAIAAGEYGWNLPYFERMLAAGAVHILQADVTRCGGITNLLRIDGLCKARNLPFSAHCAPAISAHACCAMETCDPHRVLLRPLPDREHAVRRHAGSRPTDCSRPIASRPGPWVCELKRDEAERYDVSDRRRLEVTATETIPARVDTRYRGGMAATGRRGRARVCAARLEETVEGEVRFDTASQGAVRHRRLQLPPGAARRRDPEDARRRRRHPPRLPRVRRADRQPRRRHEPLRRDGQLRRGDRPLQVPDRDRRRRPRRRRPSMCETGVINEQVNEKTGEQIGMIFGPDPSTPLALHDRRQPRQQLVRDPLRAVAALRPGAAHLGQRRGAGDRHLRRRALLGRRRRGGPARGDHRGRRAQGRDLRQAAGPARPLRGRSSASATTRSTSCRGASRATTSTSCCPSADSTSRARWSAPRARASTVLQAKFKLTPALLHADAGRGRVRRAARRRRALHGDHRAVEADRPGGA